MKKIQPINNFVLIEPHDDEQLSSGGIIIPDTAKEKKSQGKVVVIAADAPKSISVNDIIIYKEYSGTNIKFEQQEYILVPYADILAKIVEGDPI